MTKHLAEKDTIEAETKAKASWCGAQAARGQQVAVTKGKALNIINNTMIDN